MEPVNSLYKQTTRNLPRTAQLIKYMYMLLNDKAFPCLFLQNVITFKRKGRHFKTFNFKEFVLNIYLSYSVYFVYFGYSLWSVVVQNVRKWVDLWTERAVWALKQAILPQTWLDKGVHCPHDKFLPIETQVRSSISRSDWTILFNLYPLIGGRPTTTDIVCYLPHHTLQRVRREPTLSRGVEKEVPPCVTSAFI